MSSILEKIVVIGFPPDQYYREETQKNQIVLHHTCSGKGAKGDINWWLTDKRRIATHIIIDWKGTPYQLFSSRYHAHHIGVTRKFLQKEGFTDWNTRNVELNKHSIGIEIDSWGGLVKKDNKWYPAKWDRLKRKHVANTRISFIPNKRVEKYPNGYRGFYGFEKYTKEQIDTLKQLLLYWNEKYYIPLNYHKDMWDVNLDAIAGLNGIWSHTSYRSDKSDIQPQKELIEMLKGLKK